MSGNMKDMASNLSIWWNMRQSCWALAMSIYNTVLPGYTGMDSRFMLAEFSYQRHMKLTSIQLTSTEIAKFSNVQNFQICNRTMSWKMGK